MEPADIAKVYKREIYMIREATLGIMLDHPNIVKLHSAVLGENHFYCFFEWIQGEDLVDYITRVGPVPEATARKIFRSILSAIGIEKLTKITPIATMLFIVISNWKMFGIMKRQDKLRCWIMDLLRFIGMTFF